MKLTKQQYVDLLQATAKKILGYEEGLRELLLSLEDLKSGLSDLEDEINPLAEVLAEWDKNKVGDRDSLGFEMAPSRLILPCDIKLTDGTVLGEGTDEFTWGQAKEIERRFLLKGGWHLPTAYAFSKIMAECAYNSEGCYDYDVFKRRAPFIEESYYWSDTTYPYNSYLAYYLNVASGSTYVSSRSKTNSYYIACVK